MTADEYWGSTLAEIGERLHGVNERARRTWQQLAWMAAHIINVSGKTVKKPVHPDDLIGLTHERRKRLDEAYRRDKEAERRKVEG